MLIVKKRRHTKMYYFDLLSFSQYVFTTNASFSLEMLFYYFFPTPSELSVPVECNLFDIRTRRKLDALILCFIDCETQI